MFIKKYVVVLKTTRVFLFNHYKKRIHPYITHFVYYTLMVFFFLGKDIFKEKVYMKMQATIILGKIKLELEE